MEIAGQPLLPWKENSFVLTAGLGSQTVAWLVAGWSVRHFPKISWGLSPLVVLLSLATVYGMKGFSSLWYN